MNAKTLLFILICLSMARPAWGQLEVQVTGISGDNSNSRPEDAQGYPLPGLEQDNSYQTLDEAITSLMAYSPGGTIRILPNVSMQAYATITKPLTIIGEYENEIMGSFHVEGADLSIENITFNESEQNTSGALTISGATATIQNVTFIHGGVSITGNEPSVIYIRDSLFENAKPNGITAVNVIPKIDVENCVFQDFHEMNKAIVLHSQQSEIHVRDSTFTRCIVAIDDRHHRGKSLYEKTTFSNIENIGINFEWNFWMGPLLEPESIVRECHFDTVGYQGVHVHSYQNVTIEQVTAERCGFVNMRVDDGAGIGGHEGNQNIIIKNSTCNNNEGHGVFFENGNRELHMQNLTALHNKKCGFKCRSSEQVFITGNNWISGNQWDGISIDQTDGFSIQGCDIGLDETRLHAMPNERSGIYLLDPGEGKIGAWPNSQKGNVISGNKEDGIAITGRLSGELTIQSNIIGLDPSGLKAISNRKGISILAESTLDDLRINLGGKNESISTRGSSGIWEGNLISGNRQMGIHCVFTGPRSGNFLNILGNMIGVAMNGFRAIPNEAGGLVIDTANFDLISIGHESSDALGNQISGNLGNGILVNPPAGPMRIARNIIGLGLDLVSPIPNERNGILFENQVSDNTIIHNFIHHNGHYGICIDGASSVRNRISLNSIHANQKEGIKLLNGANNHIQAPVLDRIPAPDHDLQTITGTTNTPYARIEYFADPLFHDREGYWGQGKTFCNAITADTNGDFTMDMETVNHAGILTATIQDEEGNTSEFSPIVTPAVIQVVGRNTQTLVANKPTTFRVYMDQGKIPTSLSRSVDVDGSLTMNEFLIHSPSRPHRFQPWGFYHGDSMGKQYTRYWGHSSLNFTVMHPPAGDNHFTFILRERLSSTDPENGYQRAEVDLGVFHFKRTKNLRIASVPVLAPQDEDTSLLYSPIMTDSQSAIKFFGDAYPLDPYETLTRFATLEPIVLESPPHSNNEHYDLIQTLNSIREKTVPAPDYTIGVINRSVGFGRAAGFMYRNTPYCATTIDYLQTKFHSGGILAHEIGHNPPFSLSDTYAGGSIFAQLKNPIRSSLTEHNAYGNFVLEQFFAYSPTLALHHPIDFLCKGPVFTTSWCEVNDTMGAASYNWADITTYEVLFNELVIHPMAKRRYQSTQISNALVVSGRIDRNGDCSFLPLDFKDHTEEYTPVAGQSGEYTLRLLDADKKVLEQISFPVEYEIEFFGAQDENDSALRHEVVMADQVPFRVVVPNHDHARRIELRKQEATLAFIEKSPASPVIHSFSIQKDDALSSSMVTLTWHASDADADQAQNLYYDILYTPDENETIIPIRVNLRNIQSCQVDTQHVPGSEKAHFILRASDGWNTATASVPCPLSNALPWVRIMRPYETDELYANEQIYFTCNSYDPEDGVLLGNQVAWTLDEEDAIWNIGNEFFANLSLGEHIIHVKVTDTHGNQAVDEIFITVKEAPSEDTRIEDWNLLE